MRKLIMYTVFSIVLIGCEDLFHEEAISVSKIHNIEDLEIAVHGVYGRLNEAFNSWGSKGFYNPNLKGDDIACGSAVYASENPPGSDSDCNPNLHYCDFQGYHQRHSYNWKNLFSIVASANNIISQFNDSIKYDTPTRNLLGEVHLLRAYCYFRLTRIYGQVPLIYDIDIDYTCQKASYLEIYSSIEQDLTIASNLLPANNSSARIQYVTPHRGVAKALLAELYLNWAGFPILDNTKYKLAASIAEEVIDSSTFFGFSLVDDFAFLWDDAHRYNNESVFTLYFADPETSYDISEVNYMFHAFVYDSTVSFSGYYVYYLKELYFPFYPTGRKFYDGYPINYRKAITFFTKRYYDGVGIVDYSKKSPCLKIGFRKFYFNPSISSQTNYPKHNLLIGSSKIYLFRYATTLLTYAEATASAGNLNPKAYECLNAIKRRARKEDPRMRSPFDLQSGLSTEVFIDSVLWERAWELAGEPEGRWFDLVRRQMVEQLPELRYDDEAGIPVFPITKEHYFTPIPEEDVWLNPNLGE